MEFRSRPVEIVKTRMLETIAAAVEVTAGSALIINPNLVVHLLIRNCRVLSRNYAAKTSSLEATPVNVN